MSLIINLAVGGDWPGSPDGSTVFPQTFDVEHARYWTRDETELINPGFDRSGTSLNGWLSYGDTIGNVSAQSEAVLDGTHSLKLFGQFVGAENISGVYQGIVVTGGQDVIADASTFIRSEDSITDTSNELVMKLEYYSSFGAAFGGPEFLGEVPLIIADGTTSEDIWIPHQIVDVAPADAVEARISFLFRQPGFDGGAVHIDAVSLLATDPVLTGDYNGDGLINAQDYARWRATYGSSIQAGYGADGNGDGVVNAADYTVWRDRMGAGLLSDAVPEPSPLSLLATILPYFTRRRGCLSR